MSAGTTSQGKAGRFGPFFGLPLLGLLPVPVVPAADSPVLFETHVRPILETRCLKCHGGDKVKGGLDLTRKFTILKGGDSGPALVPGKPDDSLLLQRVEKGEMPP